MERPLPAPTPDMPENIARAVFTSPPKIRMTGTTSKAATTANSMSGY